MKLGWNQEITEKVIKLLARTRHPVVAYYKNK